MPIAQKAKAIVEDAFYLSATCPVCGYRCSGTAFVFEREHRPGKGEIIPLKRGDKCEHFDYICLDSGEAWFSSDYEKLENNWALQKMQTVYAALEEVNRVIRQMERAGSKKNLSGKPK